jgi:hypothetical protein
VVGPEKVLELPAAVLAHEMELPAHPEGSAFPCGFSRQAPRAIDKRDSCLTDNFNTAPGVKVNRPIREREFWKFTFTLVSPPEQLQLIINDLCRVDPPIDPLNVVGGRRQLTLEVPVEDVGDVTLDLRDRCRVTSVLERIKGALRASRKLSLSLVFSLAVLYRRIAGR